jgi:two-component system CheB/CheR fusion protein
MQKKRPQKSSERPSHIVGIGASAGGLEAIETFFKSMPPNSDLAFVVIQHLSPDYKSLMVELLTKKTQMPVHRAEDGMEVLAGNIYLIPPRKNLTIFHGKLLLNDKVNNQGINLPIDIFLRSLAEDQGEQAIAIILSGTGSDGTRGVRAIKEMGGMVMVQSEESAKFDGMPKAAAATGVADFILPPEAMPDQLLAYVAHPYVSGGKHADLLLRETDGLTKLFAILREATKVDFTYYKPSTITRRIERRMSVNQVGDFEEYVSYLQNYPAEVITLYRDLLIGVTSFFRDPEAMSELEERWLPDLFSRITTREIRFWVAGCSTGEEAYTMAIIAKEVMEKLGISRDLKIFATDIDRDALAVASTGIYPEGIIADLTPRIAGKYFYHKEEKLQVVRHLREMVVFAQHNLIKDPPFTNIDLISCRNLLIYLQPVLQRKVFEMFNFSLNPQGVLFLGTSESTGEMNDFFEPLHQKHKIFRSRGTTRTLPQRLELRPRDYPTTETLFIRSKDQRQSELESSRLIRQFLDLTAMRYLPLSLIVNERMEVVHIIGNAEGYLSFPSGPADFDINKLAPRELAIPLSTGIQKVLRTREEISFTNVRLRLRNTEQIIRISIAPLHAAKGQEPLVAVFLEEVNTSPSIDAETVTSCDLDQEARQRIRDLEHELQFARENLQATIEELETSNEELQATNEELLASNEELQSTNEELQSTNEELYTVNAEHQNKIIELTELNNDVDNLLTSCRIGMLLLDENLEIRKFSPEISNIFNIMGKDIGRPIHHLSHRLLDFDPFDAMGDVLRTNTPVEHEVRSQQDRWYLLRILPYAIGPQVYSGVVLTLVDITESRSTKNRLVDSRKTTREICHHLPVGLFVYQVRENGDLILESCNPEAERLTGRQCADMAGEPFAALWPMAESLGLLEHLQRVVATGNGCCLEDFHYDDGQWSGRFRLQGFLLPDKRLAVSLENISEFSQLSRQLLESEQRCELLLSSMGQGVIHHDQNGAILTISPAARRLLGLDDMAQPLLNDPAHRWQIVDHNGTPLSREQLPCREALTTGQPVLGRIIGISGDNLEGRRWLLVNAVPLVREEGHTAAEVFSSLQDITDRITPLASSTAANSLDSREGHQ